MAKDKILDMMKELIDGKVDANDFSFDFPDTLIELWDDIERENPELAYLLNEYMPEICANYEPDEVARRGEPELLDTKQFKAEVSKVYKQAITLLEN